MTRLNCSVPNSLQSRAPRARDRNRHLLLPPLRREGEKAPRREKEREERTGSFRPIVMETKSATASTTDLASAFARKAECMFAKSVWEITPDRNARKVVTCDQKRTKAKATEEERLRDRRALRSARALLTGCRRSWTMQRSPKKKAQMTALRSPLSSLRLRSDSSQPGRVPRKRKNGTASLHSQRLG